MVNNTFLVSTNTLDLNGLSITNTVFAADGKFFQTQVKAPLANQASTPMGCR
jgi:hypothetical protein